MKTGRKDAKARKKKGGGGSVQKDLDTAALAAELAGPICEAAGLELVHADYLRESGGRVLRIYIDRIGGVRLDDCADISRQLSDILDVAMDHVGPYHLEVSSPGPERPIGKKADFERFKGHPVKMSVMKPVEGKRKFRGVIGEITDDTVMITVDNRSVPVPFREIIRARLAG